MFKTRTITAALSDKALERVPRMFDASAPTIFSELLQNARRSGATIVYAALGPAEEATRVRIMDDGTGIQDPQVLLTFGENGWEGQAASREDAAGMGLACLAHHGCTVTSSSSGRDAWTAHLTPKAFQGKAAAEVRAAVPPSAPDQVAADFRLGTAVEFLFPEDMGRLAAMLSAAAKHFPLPVHLIRKDAGNASTFICERNDFLRGAVRTEDQGDIRIGTFRNRRYKSDPSLNFHGRLLSPDFAQLMTPDRHAWHARVDVVDCPDLKLTLPARDFLVRNDFAADLRRRVRKALYQGIIEEGSSPLSHQQFEEERSLGIDAPEPPRKLQGWEPKAPEDIYEPSPMTPFTNVPEGAFLVSGKILAPAGCTLKDALDPGELGLAFHAMPEYAGYGWYDVLPILTDLAFEPGPEVPQPDAGKAQPSFTDTRLTENRFWRPRPPGRGGKKRQRPGADSPWAFNLQKTCGIMHACAPLPPKHSACA